MEPRALYTLEVFITEGIMTEAFLDANPEVCRVLQIRGDQTLADLHKAIFDAFDREEEHLYEFQLGTDPYDLDGPRYRRKMRGGFDEDGIDIAEETTIDSLALQLNRAFGYWFDFKDDWWHLINVANVQPTIPRGKYPKVIARVGQSPPQHPKMD